MLIIIVVLLVALLASLAANVALFRQTIQDYRDLNETRLDPLGLAVFAGASAPPPDAVMRTVVFFGDSRAEEWPVPADLTAWRVVNRGIGAQTTSQALGRFEHDVAGLHPSIVVVQAGINDLKTIPLFPERKAALIAACESNLAQIVMRARAAGLRQHPCMLSSRSQAGVSAHHVSPQLINGRAAAAVKQNPPQSCTGDIYQR